MRGRLTAAVAAVVGVTALSGWLLAAAADGTPPPGAYHPRPHRVHTLTGPGASAERRRLLLGASPRYDVASPPSGQDLLTSATLPCRFLARPASGTSAKFECVLDGGEIVKVKYGRNAEIHGETAATRLLRLLGYPADDVTIVPRIRCYGCPRFPFLTMTLLSAAGATAFLEPYGYDGGYTDFEWAAVERRFPAPAIETAGEAGWAWWELDHSTVPRGEMDAFRLLAMFMAHWDNKADNQRLVCLEPAADDGRCERAGLMLQDVGATFGPPKVNLSRWRDTPLWADRRQCRISMQAMPRHGATFPDAEISEKGRVLLAGRLARLSDADVRDLFQSARFGAFHAGTGDERDLAAWAAAFRHRVDQIDKAGPCPVSTARGSSRPIGRT